MESQVRQVLVRVLSDDDFLDQMLTDPERALESYELSDEERGILTRRDRDLVELMRIAGTRTEQGFNLDVTIIISIILDLSLDLTLDLTVLRPAEREADYERQVAALSSAVLAAKSGADRLERLQELMQVVNGATTLVRRTER